MENTVDNISTTTECDDDDYGNYFLQPASSPYNISEKVKEANHALFNEDPSFHEKGSKVKFKEDLVDYEPEMSYDDASSIESEDNIDYSLMEHDTTVLESQLQTALILNVCNTDEEEEEDEEIVEDIDDETIISDYSTSQEKVNFDVQCENIMYKQLHELQYEVESTNRLNKSEETAKSGRSNFSKKSAKVEDISCKRHCIDDIDRLDFNANISVKKINLTEKPYQCPRLKLQRRNCCEKNETKIQQKLPRYSGLRSEYGLNAIQIERRERRKDIIRMREQERQRIIEENKRRRVEQNEQIFCQWLKSVATRKTQPKKTDRIKHPLSSTIITFPNKTVEAIKQRPKTASEIFPKHSVKKKRPNTTSTCIFIEVPHSVLHKGINIGDLLVTKSSTIASKKLHVLTVT